MKSRPRAVDLTDVKSAETEMREDSDISSCVGDRLETLHGLGMSPCPMKRKAESIWDVELHGLAFDGPQLWVINERAQTLDHLIGLVQIQEGFCST